jgi:hypothetical protein
MNFTPKIKGGPIACGILTMAAVGWSGPINVAREPVPMVATQNMFAVSEFFQTNGVVPITPAVEGFLPASAQSATPDYIHQTHWYNNRSWWKRNAPIIGGAAGGGLIGGLAGGGKGLLIGGAAGAGGGALYKHFRHRRYHEGTASRYGQPQRYRQPQR